MVALEDGAPIREDLLELTTLEVWSDGILRRISQTHAVQDRTLSVHAMNPDPDAEPTTYAMNGYEAYYDPVVIDEVDNTFAITVESSLVRDLIGQELERVFEVTEDQLVITPVNPEEG